jgi:hypothetical protein
LQANRQVFHFEFILAGGFDRFGHWEQIAEFKLATPVEYHYQWGCCATFNGAGGAVFALASFAAARSIHTGTDDQLTKFYPQTCPVKFVRRKTSVTDLTGVSQIKK